MRYKAKQIGKLEVHWQNRTQDKPKQSREYQSTYTFTPMMYAPRNDVAARKCFRELRKSPTASDIRLMRIERYDLGLGWDEPKKYYSYPKHIED